MSANEKALADIGATECTRRLNENARLRDAWVVDLVERDSRQASEIARLKAGEAELVADLKDAVAWLRQCATLESKTSLETISRYEAAIARAEGRVA